MPRISKLPAGQPRLSATLDRTQDFLDHPVHLARFMPVPYQLNVMLWIDPDDVSAVTDCGKARSRAARPLLPPRVQPPQISVVWSVERGCRGFRDPLLRDQLPALPLAPI